MTAMFAFSSRRSHAGGIDRADTAPLPDALYRSEAFAEDLELMPAPQAVRSAPREAAPQRQHKRVWGALGFAPSLA